MKGRNFEYVNETLKANTARYNLKLMESVKSNANNREFQERFLTPFSTLLSKRSIVYYIRLSAGTNAQP